MLESFSKPSIVCWDFDLTITRKHVHNLLWDALGQQKCTRENYLSYYQEHYLNESLINHLDELAETIMNLHSQGIQQAAVSFTNFSKVILPSFRFILKTYMMKGLGAKDPMAHSFCGDEQIIESLQAEYKETEARVEAIVDEILQDFYIAPGFPTHEGAPREFALIYERKMEACKSQHLNMVKSHFGIHDNSALLLVDDCSDNIVQAAAEGYRVCLADLKGGHLKRIAQMCVFTSEPALLQSSLEKLSIEEARFPMPLSRSFDPNFKRTRDCLANPNIEFNKDRESKLKRTV